MNIQNHSSMKEPKPARSPHTSPTIAYFTHHMNDHNGEVLWTGAVEGAQKQDVNLICFVGETLKKSDNSTAQGNILYDLVTPEIVDGVVSWNSILCQHLDHDEMMSFYHRYHPLPVVCMTQRLEGRPVVMIDTYQGMREAIVHLIEVHGYRRIAFIRGPETHVYGQERYRAYTETLEEYHIPFDPNLVTPPAKWLDSEGSKAIKILFEQRGLRPQVDVEAVVADTDLFALEALQALLERGIRVPEDVAIIGFNDFIENRWLIPPLTSVAMPFREQGEQAVNILLRILEGKEIDEQISLSARLVIRQSCGCPSEMVLQAGTISRLSSQSERFETVLADRRATLLSEIVHAVGTSVSGFKPDWAEHLVDVSTAEICGGASGRFLSELYEVLRRVIATDGNVLAWQNVISALRRYTRAELNNDDQISRAETLWGQARIMIGEAGERMRGFHQLQAQRQTDIMGNITQALITTFDVKGLMDVLAQGLPRLSIPGCYLALYENPQPYIYPQSVPEWSRLILAYNEHGRLNLGEDGRRFLSRQLLPIDIWPRNRSYSLVVEPLYFGEEQIGFVIFEVGPKDGRLYETLQVEISSALQGALLVQRVQEHEAEVVRQKYILDTFMETVPDRIYFKDLNSRYTKANKAHANKLGLSDPAQEVGKTDFDFYPEEVAQRTRNDEQQIIRTGNSLINKEVYEIETDGNVRWSLVTKMPLRDEHETIVGTFGISRDITTLKQTQAALEQAYTEVEQRVEERTAELQQEIIERQWVEAKIRHLQKYLQNIIDSMPAVLIGVDTQGRVTHWNRAAETFTGLTAATARDCPLTAVFPQMAGQMDHIRHAIRDGTPQRTLKVAHTHEGVVRYADITVYPLIANGAEGAVILAVDVTDQVRIEEMMIQTEKMLTVGNLAAGMAHEINNPLGVILQGIQNTFRRLSPDLPKNQEIAAALGIRLDLFRTYLEQRNILEYLHKMEEAGQRAAQIVAHMLNFSRPSQASMVLIDLHQLLDQSINLASSDFDLKKEYDFRHITITRTYEATLPQVPCLPSEIQQVLLNLLRNAAQALAEPRENHDPLTIRITTRRDHDYARIDIADNGPGMNEEVQKRMFEPFYTTKEVGIGTGLGLSVSYFIIVTHHHGKIFAESAPGKGATFTIMLPFSKMPESKRSTSPGFTERNENSDHR
jgi:PAS domain S-box-containing protein